MNTLGLEAQKKDICACSYLPLEIFFIPESVMYVEAIDASP